MLGFYNIIKPTGMSSTAVVSVVKHITGAKCGHLGTLDPMAAGVLPVAVGKTTKLFDYFLSKDKRYVAIGLFGVSTDTLDAEGTLENRQNVDIQKTQIDAILGEFCGQIDQIPPKYSSISINGQRAYDLARSGKNVEIPPRRVQIYSVSCDKKLGPNLFQFSVHCSAGTYIRTLIMDIAQRLQTIATTVCIIRTASGKFDISNAITLDELRAAEDKENLLTSIDSVVDLPHQNFDKTQSAKLLNGQILPFDGESGQYLAYCGQTLLGIAKAEGEKIKIDINLCALK